MPAARVSVNGAGCPPDQEDREITRKRIFEALSESLSQTGRKKKHKKYAHLLLVISI